MARIGVNPARGKFTEYRPSRVTVTMVTYVPNLEGYFKHKLEVVKASLLSMVQNIPEGYDVLIFDNGSCEQLVEFLDDLYNKQLIDYLLLSRRNLGKIGALSLLFQAAPGEIIAYSDDDIFFYPGWLSAQMKILNTFPRVGMVSGVPVRNANTYARNTLDNLLAALPDGWKASFGRFIPDEWEVDWAVSTGRDPEQHLIIQAQRQDVLLKYNELEALAGANHFQFLAPKELLVQIMPGDWQGQLMGYMVEMDENLDALGYLRVSTKDRFTRHLGNVLNESVQEEVKQLDIQIRTVHSVGRRKHWLLRVPGSGRFLHWLYNRLFHIIHEIE